MRQAVISEDRVVAHFFVTEYIWYHSKGEILGFIMMYTVQVFSFRVGEVYHNMSLFSLLRNDTLTVFIDIFCEKASFVAQFLRLPD